MFLKLHSVTILQLTPTTPNISDFTDVCQHFVVLLCIMEVIDTAHSKKMYITFATCVSKAVTEGILWVRTKKSGWLT